MDRLNQRITTASVLSFVRACMRPVEGGFPSRRERRTLRRSRRRSDRSISGAIDAAFYSGVFLALGPPIWPWAPSVCDCGWNLESIRGKRARERTSERASARERAHGMCLMHYIDTHALCACACTKCVHAWVIGDGGERFTSLWVVDQIRRISLPASLADSRILTSQVPRFDWHCLIIFVW